MSKKHDFFQLFFLGPRPPKTPLFGSFDVREKNREKRRKKREKKFNKREQMTKKNPPTTKKNLQQASALRSICGKLSMGNAGLSLKRKEKEDGSFEKSLRLCKDKKGDHILK
jgi:hypothetical protein